MPRLRRAFDSHKQTGLRNSTSLPLGTQTVLALNHRLFVTIFSGAHGNGDCQVRGSPLTVLLRECFFDAFECFDQVVHRGGERQADIAFAAEG